MTMVLEMPVIKKKNNQPLIQLNIKVEKNRISRTKAMMREAAAVILMTERTHQR